MLGLQEQLARMREELERVEKQLSGSSGRPSPLERIKRVFTRAKHSKSKNGGEYRVRLIPGGHCQSHERGCVGVHVW